MDLDSNVSGVPGDRPSIKTRKQKRFLPSIPESLFDPHAALPGKCLAIYQVLLQRSRMENHNPVVLTTARLSRCGISRNQKQRALKDLEKAGFIRVEKRGRSNPLIHLLVTVT
jgi:hypothetical protein